MDKASCLAAFAERFVASDYRERFVHEATKKPHTLHRRVCHEIDRLFAGKYKGAATSIRDGELVFFLTWSSGMIETTWGEAKTTIARGGGGHLVVRANATAFFAEAEGYPALTYGDGG